MKNVLESKELIHKVPYIDIASVTSDGMPWLSPVWFASDEEYNFYWTSSPDSQHSKNIENKNDIFITIYDTSGHLGGEGLYALAKAYELKEEVELKKAIDVFYKKKGSDPKPVEDFVGGSPKRMYKAVPIKFWVNDYDKTRIPADIKTEIKLI